jgi:D-glycero-D-manno-heptose 1,7-bisphosphate phosphatase
LARIPDKQAVFFELDGVLLEAPRLLPDGTLPWLPGALEALVRIDPATFRVFLATNREDIAMGTLRERDFKRVCDRFLAETRAAGVEIAKIYTCPYHPKGKARFRKDSVFRKPAPGMFKMAQQEFDLNLPRCWMVGHTTVDVLAGGRAGVGTILVHTGAGGRDGGYVVEPNAEARDVREAVRYINTFELSLRC